MSSMKKVHHNEDGLVAIIVSTIIMVILSLTTLGFARLMQREQRQALDRSLSTQAFYAAESAVNDVAQKINSNTLPPLDKKTCDTTGADGNPYNGSIDPSLSVSYSCLLITQSPLTLEYTNGSISTNSSKIVAVSGSNNEPIHTIKIDWEGATKNVTGSTYDCSGVRYPSASNWGFKTGILRVDVIPADALDRASLINNMITVFLYPSCSTGVSTIDYSTLSGAYNTGKIIPVGCKDGTPPYGGSDDRTRDCQINITTTGHENKLYYLRLKSIYVPSNVTIRLFDTAIQQISIKNAQVQVDATGKVNDVLRRVQVRIPVKITMPLPEAALQTTNSICKLLGFAPPAGASPAFVDTSCPD